MAYSVGLIRTVNKGDQWLARIGGVLTAILNDPTQTQAYTPSSDPSGLDAWDSIFEQYAVNVNTLTKGTSYTLIFPNGTYLDANRALDGRLTITSHPTGGSGGTFTTMPLEEDDYYLALLCNDGTQKAQFAVVSHAVRDYLTYVAYFPVGPYETALYTGIKGSLAVPDPYKPGGTSTTSGHEATGTFDDASDSVTEPALPNLNLALNGFISAYAPTLSQINDLAAFIWSDWISGTPVLPKIFANPSDAIISLHMLPFEPSTSTAIPVTVGHYTSGVSMDPMTLQFYVVNCGSLDVEEYWGNYLDYNPYTKLTLFLPYVGEITLNPDEVMAHTITVKYHVDAMTGAFVCFVIREDDKILGEYAGNCALQVPISSANYAQLHSALLGLAGAAVGMATGAAGSGIAGLLSGGSDIVTSAAGMMDSKVRHSHSGALGSAAGFMGSQAPYLIIERARQCLPEDLNVFAGYPSMITAKLESLHGFTSVADVVLDGIPLTDEELAELREILKGGVYL